MWQLVGNMVFNMLPITIAIAQMIETIVVYWKPKNMHDLKLKYREIGYQVGTIVVSIINFTPNRNQLPTFGHEDYNEAFSIFE